MVTTQTAAAPQGRLWPIRHLAGYADLAALQDVSPLSFRRTVATEIDEVYDAEAAMNQLAHVQGGRGAALHQRRLLVPDYRAATDRPAPGPETSDGPTPGLWDASLAPVGEAAVTATEPEN